MSTALIYFIEAFNDLFVFHYPHEWSNSLSTTNSLKLTKTSSNAVFVNHAQVSTADVQAANGVVHVINRVVLPVN